MLSLSTLTPCRIFTSMKDNAIILSRSLKLLKVLITTFSCRVVRKTPSVTNTTMGDDEIDGPSMFIFIWYDTPDPDFV